LFDLLLLLQQKCATMSSAAVATELAQTGLLGVMLTSGRHSPLRVMER